MSAVLSAEAVQEQLLRAPFHRWLGLSVERVDADGIALLAQAGPDWLNSDGGATVHGGLVSSLLDVAADWALLSVGLAPAPTIDHQVHYLRPVGLGEIRVTGRVLKPGRTVTVAEAEIVSGGKVAAVSRGTYLSVTAAAS